MSYFSGFFKVNFVKFDCWKFEKPLEKIWKKIIRTAEEKKIFIFFSYIIFKVKILSKKIRKLVDLTLSNYSQITFCVLRFLFYFLTFSILIVFVPMYNGSLINQ